jgi:hypothetical protein
MSQIDFIQTATPETHLQAKTEFETARSGQPNQWLLEGQADDRIPMNGAVKDSGETSAGQRSFARRSHQAMFKRWSQARHD